MRLRLFSRNKGSVVPMEVTWFSTPEEGTEMWQQDQDHVNCGFLIGKVLSNTSVPLQAKQLMKSTSSMFFIGWEMQYNENGHSYGQLVIGSFITATCLLMHHISCRVFWWNIKSPRWLSPTIAQIWHPVTSGFSQNSNHLWKERYQTVDEIQENTMGQLMVIPTKDFAEYFEQLKRC